jgi:hypothetical protein
MSFNYLVVLGLSLIFSALGFSAFGQKPTDSTIVGGTLTLEGKIVDAYTSVPLPKATVLLSKVSEDGNTGQVISTVTDSDGRYTFKKLVDGVYKLAAAGRGHALQEFGARGPQRFGTLINLFLKSGQTRTIEMGLLPMGAIEGGVLDSRQQPIPEYFVDLLQTRPYREKLRAVLLGSRRVRDGKGFTFAELASGDYWLRIRLPLNQNLKLSPSTTNVCSDYAGLATVTYFAAGASLSSAQAIHVVDGSISKIGNVVIQDERGACLDVNMTSTPPPKIRVGLLPKETAGMQAAPLEGWELTNTDGTFSAGPITRGDYSIAAIWSEGDAPNFALLEEHVGTRPNVAKLSPSTSVTIQGTVVPPDREKLGRRRIAPKGKVFLKSDLFFFWVREADITNDGTFTFQNVAPNEYSLSLELVDVSLSLDRVIVSGRPGSAEYFSVKDSIETLELFTTDECGRVQGTINGFAKRPQFTPPVLVSTASGSDEARTVLTASLRPNGDYDFSCVPLGEFYLLALDDVRWSELTSKTFLMPYLGKAQKVSVAARGSVGKTLDLFSTQ